MERQVAILLLQIVRTQSRARGLNWILIRVFATKGFNRALLGLGIFIGWYRANTSLLCDSAGVSRERGGDWVGLRMMSLGISTIRIPVSFYSLLFSRLGARMEMFDLQRDLVKVKKYKKLLLVR